MTGRGVLGGMGCLWVVWVWVVCMVVGLYIKDIYTAFVHPTHTPNTHPVHTQCKEQISQVINVHCSCPSIFLLFLLIYNDVIVMVTMVVMS